MTASLQFLISGVLFGLVAGVSPGPLLTLVISETLRRDRKAGLVLACVPIFSDVPGVLLSIFVLARLSSSDLVLGIISILGALFILYLSYETIRVEGVEIRPQGEGPDSDSLGSYFSTFRKGLIANFLNPHPYVFWMTIGAPNALKAYRINMLSPVLFILGFYLFLVGSKMVVASIVDTSKTFLKSTAYIYIIRALGLALLVFAILFLKDGLEFLGII